MLSWLRIKEPELKRRCHKPERTREIFLNELPDGRLSGRRGVSGGHRPS
jgi:hypothetical protein